MSNAEAGDGYTSLPAQIRLGLDVSNLTSN